ncbi:VWA domain-containing protein [Candidatus Woesearchaeota archaeon]|nr:VWA domain-containing protein [Candidatus Woesearchaeota archaeon]
MHALAYTGLLLASAGTFSSLDEGIPPLTEQLPDADVCTELDVLFLFDTTGSMDHYLAAAQEVAGHAAQKIQADIPHARFAVASVADFPQFGISKDRPYISVLDFQGDASLVGRVILPAQAGGDIPEAYPYALRMASNERWNAHARRYVVLFADSHARDDNTLEASIQYSNYTLLPVLADEGSQMYWSRFVPSVFSLSPLEKLEDLLFTSLKGQCSTPFLS